MSLRTLCLSLTLFALSCSEDPARRPPGGGGNGQDLGVGGGGGGGGNGDDGGGGGGGPTCVDGQCQMTCPGGGTTTLSGKVYAPNGTLPLYNAIVYIPSVPVDPFTSGVTC